MREILFRGKTWDGEWEYGSLHIETGETDADGNRQLDHRILGLRGECRYVIPETVGQYTGLTDRNGEKIFEGDILTLLTGRTYIVKFEDGGFILTGTTIPMKYADKFEVIGNIHDNPELMEG